MRVREIENVDSVMIHGLGELLETSPEDWLGKFNSLGCVLFHTQIFLVVSNMVLS